MLTSITRNILAILIVSISVERLFLIYIRLYSKEKL